MNDLISRSALLTVPNVRKVTEYDEGGWGMSYNAVPEEAIEKAPAVDAEPVRHARWESTSFGTIKCTLCGCSYNLYRGFAQYCPSCGAKMDGEDNG